jgi:hypothetical protein
MRCSVVEGGKRLRKGLYAAETLALKPPRRSGTSRGQKVLPIS